MLELQEYVIKGMDADINELCALIQKGESLLSMIRRGEATKSSKTKDEILDIIQVNQNKLDELKSKRFDFHWGIMTKVKGDTNMNIFLSLRDRFSGLHDFAYTYADTEQERDVIVSALKILGIDHIVEPLGELWRIEIQQ